MIEEVKCLATELYLHAFPHSEILRHGEVHVRESWSLDIVAVDIAEGSQRWQNICRGVDASGLVNYRGASASAGVTRVNEARTLRADVQHVSTIIRDRYVERDTTLQRDDTACVPSTQQRVPNHTQFLQVRHGVSHSDRPRYF